MIIKITDTCFIKACRLEYDKEFAIVYLESVKEIINISLLSEEKYRLLEIGGFRESLKKAVIEKMTYWIEHNHPIDIEELKQIANTITRIN